MREGARGREKQEGGYGLIDSHESGTYKSAILNRSIVRETNE